jgi:hypothetical protein
MVFVECILLVAIADIMLFESRVSPMQMYVTMHTFKAMDKSLVQAGTAEGYCKLSCRP